MSCGAEVGGLAREMEVEVSRRLFPLPFFESHLVESVRPDARPLSSSRSTSVAFNPVSTSDASALVKIGVTTMLAAIKLEVMTPSSDSPDQGSIAVEFHMPPICLPTVRPGRPAEVAPMISKQLSDVLISSGMVDLTELSLIKGKAAWMAYLDVYCLNADGSLFDAALFSAVAAFSYLQIPLVCVNEDGRVLAVSEDQEGESKLELVKKEKRKLSLSNIPFSLTCMLHEKYIFVDPTAEEESNHRHRIVGKYIFVDPTAEEESIMDTIITVVLDSQGRLVSVYKAGGCVLAYNSALQECVALTKGRVTDLQDILKDAMSNIGID